MICAKLQVAQVASQDLEETKDRLLAELAIRIERPEVANESAYAQQAKILPDLLRDPVLRDHLLDKDKAIHRITRLGLEGITEEDDDDSGLFIVENDLPLNLEESRRCECPGVKAVKRLASSARLRSEAVSSKTSNLGGRRRGPYSEPE